MLSADDEETKVRELVRLNAAYIYIRAKVNGRFQSVALSELSKEEQREYIERFIRERRALADVKKATEEEP